MTRTISSSLALLLILSVAFTGPFDAIAAPEGGELKLGQKFEIIGELYAHSVCDDLNTREVSIISLVPLRLSGPEIITRQLVPIGSVLTIVEKAPKKFLAFLYPERYFVRVNTIATPARIPVTIDISRGIEGESSVLNPRIFKPLL